MYFGQSMAKDDLKARFAWLMVLFVFLSFVIPPLANAQIGENGGTTELRSDISMMSGIPVHGGGHFTWKVSGDAAGDFRNALIDQYDEPEPQGPPNGILESDEVRIYIHQLEYYLEHNDLMYNGAKLRAFSLLNQDITTDTKGLIGTSSSSSGDIEIKFYFDAWVPTGSQDISLSDTTINDAIYAPLNETFHGTYKIEHTGYMVNIADYSNVKINKGSFFLIRTPFGEIYHYSVTFKAGEETGDELMYEDFNWIECPLILFIVVAVFGYFTVTMPDRFRRHDVLKIGLLHTIAKVLLLILLVLYFFAGFGGFFVSGVYLWILGVVFLFMTLVLSKTMYENAERIKPKPKPEPSAIQAKKEPVAEVAEEPEAEVGKRDVQCSTCGEIFQLAEFDTVSSAMCPACGEMGAIYLQKDEGIPLEEPPPESPPLGPPPGEPSEPPPKAPPPPPPEPPQESPEAPPAPKEAPPPPKRRPPRPPKKKVKDSKKSEEESG